MQSSEDEAQMADRKRSLTAPTSPGRRQGPAQAESSSHTAAAGSSASTALTSGEPGSSRAHAIDLTSDVDGNTNERPLPPSPPAPPPPAHPLPRTSRPTAPSPPRRSSELVLPRWQPDSDVTECPVCHNQFTFWYRKHHCRKCGRVVCANCSPHRITIPRQFIVRPPEPPGGIMDLTGESSSTSPTNSQAPQHLWGGEEVRVCNPCVPDPNLSPPPGFPHQQVPHRYSGDPFTPQSWRAISDAAPPSLRHPPQPGSRNSLHLPPHPGQMPPHMGHRATLSHSSGLQHLQNSHNLLRAMENQSVYGLGSGVYPSQSPTARGQFPPQYLPNTRYYPPRVSSAATPFGTSAPSHLPAPSRPYHNRPLTDITTPPAVPPPPPRRQIAEEDECPICGEELPPKGPNGETEERERHVEECIASHLYTNPSTPPSRTTSAPPAASSTAPMQGSQATSAAVAVPSSATATTSSTPLGSAPSGATPSSSTPLRQRRMTGGRMLVYKATEKDCVGGDGEPAECVICLDDFEPGDEMGRLECLCRFHRTCIRGWWERKGAGSCPTHQLHD